MNFINIMEKKEAKENNLPHLRLNFDINKTACNNCPYRRVCYRDKYDAKDYRKDVLKHFKKGAK